MLKNYGSCQKTAFGFPVTGTSLTFTALLKPYFWQLLLGAVLLLLSSVIVLAFPKFINGGITLIEKAQTAKLNFGLFALSISDIYDLLLLMVSFALLGAIVRILSRMVVFDVGRRIERDVRARLFFHISIFDDTFFRNVSVGDAMNRMTSDVVNIRLITGFAALNIMNIVFVFALTVPYLWRIDEMLAIAALLPFPLVILATGFLTQKMFNKTKAYQEELSNLTTHVQENLLGAQVVRLFHQQKEEEQRFLQTNQKTLNAALELSRVRIFMYPILRFVLGASVGLVILLGGQAMIAGRINLGDFVEVNARILMLAWPAMSVGFVMSIYNQGKASLTRINNILNMAPVILDGDVNIGPIEKIDVVNLNANFERPTNLINFSVERGQLLGIVGQSGSFKSTLLRCISRRKLVKDGVIFFNEHDINSLSLTSLYENISVVSEDAFLFNRSIVDNVRLANTQASMDDVKNALSAVGLDDDVRQFSKGIDTVVGERGITLSGGQRQRLALARALVANKSVLILDDALSMVDAKTESLIIENLKPYFQNRLVIFASHRFGVLKNADKIFVLAKGQIVQSGSHAELVKQSGIYAELCGGEGV